MSDESLEDGLGDTAWRALDQWSAQHGIWHRLDKWLIDGHSGAKVAIVDRHKTRHGGSQKLVLKLDRLPDDATASEYSRLDQAWAASGDFAERHLARPTKELLNVGDGRWITFQELAGADLGQYKLLSSQLAGFLGEGGDSCGAVPFARACRRIAHGVLHDWAGDPQVRYQTVPDHFRMMLGDRLSPGKPLASLLAGQTKSSGPFALLSDDHLTAGIEVSTIVGRSHGDLHVENVLVQVAPNFKPGRYYLVDLAKYEEEGPLARDPIHFLLHLINRTLPVLSAPQSEAAIEMLVDPASDRTNYLPGWLSLVVTEVYKAGDEWIRSSGFGPDWRKQRLLALVACAFMIHVRRSTRPEDKEWFLRLAERATDAFLGVDAVRRPLASVPVTASATDEPSAQEKSTPRRRLALLLANDHFQDPSFRALTAPSVDLPSLGEVLRDPRIGEFEVTELENGSHADATRKIERFFAAAESEDFLLLYFSGHGVKDAAGNLCLVASDSQLSLLGSTGIQARMIREWMNDSMSRRIVVILDCCHAGAFPPGTKAAPDIDLAERLSGQGTVVLAASSAYQYAFEGEHPSAVGALPPPSVFTGALIEGLRTGDADLDGDGWIDAAELFSYARARTRERTRLQNPRINSAFDTPLRVARSVRPSAPNPGPRAAPKATDAEPLSWPVGPGKTTVGHFEDERESGETQPPDRANRALGVALLACLGIVAIMLYFLWGSGRPSLTAEIDGFLGCGTTTTVGVTLTNRGSHAADYVIAVDGVPRAHGSVLPKLTRKVPVAVSPVGDAYVNVTVLTGSTKIREANVRFCQ
jgi:hypothetical protein